MNYTELDEIFDDEIRKRDESSEWSSHIVTRVFSSIRRERSRKLINISSYILPVAAAAVLLLVLNFKLNPNHYQYNNYPVNTEDPILLNEVSGILFDDVDLYINSLSRR